MKAPSPSGVFNTIKQGKALLGQWGWGLLLLIFLYMALPR
jgi:hypothetical protein